MFRQLLCHSLLISALPFRISLRNDNSDVGLKQAAGAITQEF
jgi:hypothetical protein